jgi:predicted glutamine amidotransferase
MCRLFLALNNHNVKENLVRFFKLSVKSTHVAMDRGIKLPRDGYGFGWMDNKKKWHIYRKAVLPHRDSVYPDVLGKAAQNVVIAHLRHINYRRITKKAPENNHPFIHDNQTFMHNGQVHLMSDNQMLELKGLIDQDLVKFIKGDTDAEAMFYLFLTIKKKMDEKYPDESTSLKKSFQKMVRILKETKLHIDLNFIYTNPNRAFITRFSHHPEDKGRDSIPLFIDKSDGILITSEPITEEAKMMRHNSVMVIEF